MMKISFRKLNKSKGGAELCQDAMRAPTHDLRVRRMVIEATATWLSLKLLVNDRLNFHIRPSR